MYYVHVVFCKNNFFFFNAKFWSNIQNSSLKKLTKSRKFYTRPFIDELYKDFNLIEFTNLIIFLSFVNVTHQIIVQLLTSDKLNKKQKVN